VRLELDLARSHPAVGGVGYTVELQYGDTAVFGLLHRSLKVLQSPRWPSVARRRYQQGMIEAGFVGTAATFVIGILRRPAAPRESDAQIAQEGQGLRVNGVAWIGEAHGNRNQVLPA